MENPADWSSDLVPETGSVDIADIIEAAKLVQANGSYRDWITLLQFVGAGAEHFAWENYEAFDASDSRIVDGVSIAAEYILSLEKG